MQRGNFFTNYPDTHGGEVIEVLSRMTGKDIRVERILTETADPTTWYDQPWPEWVLILKGAAKLEFNNPPAEEHLNTGDWLLIPTHRPHRVLSTTPPTLWLAIHAGSGEV